jgi:hypothetical protein
VRAGAQGLGQAQQHTTRRGAPKDEGKKKWNGGISGRWPINQVQVGRYLSVLFFLIFEIFFMAFLCVSQQELLAEKVEKKKTFFLSSFPIEIFFIAFLAVRFST